MILIKINLATEEDNGQNEMWTLNKRLDYMLKVGPKCKLNSWSDSGLIVESIKASERNAVVEYSNSTRFNFLAASNF